MLALRYNVLGFVCVIIASDKKEAVSCIELVVRFFVTLWLSPEKWFPVIQVKVSSNLRLVTKLQASASSF